MRIGFLMGQAPGSASMLPEVVARLEAAGASVTSHIVTGGAPPPAVLRDADLVALRGLDLASIEAARELEAHGVRCCNTVGATLAARDKVRATEALARAGVPAPAARVVQDWSAARAAAAERPVAVKSLEGSRGVGVVVGDVPEEAPFGGPYLVQDLVPGDGLDRKVYVVGERLGGVLRRWPPQDLDDKRGRAFAPDDATGRAALDAARALGLEICGVDVIAGPAGPSVVDVNAFPGFKGVPPAAEWIAAHLLAAARDGAP